MQTLKTLPVAKKTYLFRAPYDGFYRKFLNLLVGYRGEPKVNIFHNIRIVQGLYYPKRLKVTYSTTRGRFFGLQVNPKPSTSGLGLLGLGPRVWAVL